MILANPAAVPHITGMTVGTLTVDSFSHRDATGFKFNIRCNRCGDAWPESYRRIMDGFLHQGCHNTLCRLDRLPESKKSTHERWLDSPEPVATPAPEPVKVKPVQRVEQVSVDYLRYLAACQKTGTPSSVPWREFDLLGTRLHKDIMARVARIEEKN